MRESVRAWMVTVSAGLSLLGVLIAGKLTRDAARNWDRYTVAFAAIECTPPPGQERLDFLTEVQYLAGMPNHLSVLDEGLASRIADAFARHPCVEKVEKVIVRPTRQVSVRLQFRIPGRSRAAVDQRSLPLEDPP
jgi:hypothetical protein